MRILSALHPDASLGTVIDVMAMLGAIDEDAADAVKEAVVPVVVDLVRHGLVLPVDLLADGDAPADSKTTWETNTRTKETGE